jgi:integrase
MQAKISATLVLKLKPESKPYEVNDTETAGFLVRVQPSGSISYYCTFRTLGKRNRLSLGRYPTITPAQARDHARRVIASVVQGGDPVAHKKRPKSHTLASLLDDEYLPWATANHKNGTASVARIKTVFASFLKLPLDDITPLQVERWRNRRIDAHLTASTVNRDLASLKSALSKAVEWGLVKSHPLQRVKLAKLDNVGVLRYLSDQEGLRLQDSLNAREERLRTERDTANRWRQERRYPLLPDLRITPFADHLKPMVQISLGTGLRRGELFNLKWSDVDLAQANLTVRGTTAKSGKTRHVPLNADVVDVFEKWRSQSAITDEYVFTSSAGRPFDNVNKAWSAVLEKAGIAKFRWHDMRHDFASHLVMAGVDLNTVRELLGHADLKMTLRYAHLAQEHKAAAVEKLIKGLQ